MYRVLSVFGTRPEAIKMAPVVRTLAAMPSLEARIAVTAQHRDMLDRVLHLFSITPDYDLDLMRPGQGLAGMTGAMLAGLDPVLADFAPDLLLVHGDTMTTLAAALAAYYRRIPVGHVEAGLRSGTIFAPWPEEINRRVVGTIARLHFAPTEEARANLLSENVPDAHIFVTGNTVIDALKEIVARLEADPCLCARLDRSLGIDPARRLILVTGHRRENHGGGLERICEALSHLARRVDVNILCPLHPNPDVQRTVAHRLGQMAAVRILPPQDYLSFVHLMRRATLILTDSGGVQEEAPTLGKPVLLLRDCTERPEAVKAGAVRLVGTDSGQILSQVARLLDDDSAYRDMARPVALFGDGKAAHRIGEAVQEFLARGDSAIPNAADPPPIMSRSPVSVARRVRATKIGRDDVTA